MRSLLFAPGSSDKMMAKALGSGADAVIFDLEDSVVPDRKAEARGCVARVLRTAPQPRPRLYVRVNPLSGKQCSLDLAAVIALRPDGIVLPKVGGPQDLAAADAVLRDFEPAQARGRTAIIAICTETAASTLSLACASWRHPRLTGLLWGGEDLSVDIGATGNRDAEGVYTGPFQLARNLCLLAARAARVTPIDAVFTDYRDADGLTREAAAARRDGFEAKAAIHPNQIPLINHAFTPTEEELVWAQRVVDALEKSDAGAVQLDGVMIDAPHLAQARRILAIAGGS